MDYGYGFVTVDEALIDILELKRGTRSHCAGRRGCSHKKVVTSIRHRNLVPGALRLRYTTCFPKSPFFLHCTILCVCL